MTERRTKPPRTTGHPGTVERFVLRGAAAQAAVDAVLRPVAVAELELEVEVREALAGAIGFIESYGDNSRPAAALAAKLRATLERLRAAWPCKACGGDRVEHDQSPRCRGFE